MDWISTSSHELPLSIEDASTSFDVRSESGSSSELAQPVISDARINRRIIGTTTTDRDVLENKIRLFMQLPRLPAPGRFPGAVLCGLPTRSSMRVRRGRSKCGGQSLETIRSSAISARRSRIMVEALENRSCRSARRPATRTVQSTAVIHFFEVWTALEWRPAALGKRGQWGTATGVPTGAPVSGTSAQVGMGDAWCCVLTILDRRRYPAARSPSRPHSVRRPAGRCGDPLQR